MIRWSGFALGGCFLALLGASVLILAPDIETDAVGSVDEFLWRADGAMGMAVMHGIGREDFSPSTGPQDLQVLVQLRGDLAEYWHVEDAQAFYREGDRQIRLVRQGPYPDRDTTRQPLLSAWTLRDLCASEYQFQAFLRQTKPGLPPEAARNALEEDGAITFQVRMLPKGLPSASTDGTDSARLVAARTTPE